MSAARKNHPSQRQNESIDYSAPLGSWNSGRLVLTSGAKQIELRATPSMPYLYQARFRIYAPRVWRQENLVTVEFRSFSPFELLANRRRTRADISLNGSIPWEIEVRNGVSHMDADLGQLQLRSLDILGGADRIRLALPKPSGTTFIYISGGLNHGVISAPSTAAIKVRVGGGANNLTFADRRFGPMGGEAAVESPDFESATDRYDIYIADGANHLTINREG